MPPVRVYADTSVFGGCFDTEFSQASLTFFEQVRSGRFQLIASAIIEGELQPGPPDVRQFFDEHVPFIQIIEVSLDAVALQRAYLDAEIVSRKWEFDALHVALATVSACQVIVSWNFKHIVHFQKIPLYNEVNRTNGYAPIAIFSPHEVIAYEDQNI